MITAGTLQLGNGGNAGSIIGNVVNNGIISINRANQLFINDPSQERVRSSRTAPARHS